MGFAVQAPTYTLQQALITKNSYKPITHEADRDFVHEGGKVVDEVANDARGTAHQVPEEVAKSGEP